MVVRMACGLLFGLALMSCTDEGSTPIDLRATTTSQPASSGVPVPEADPNADARQQMRDLAEQQCLDDPEKIEGVVRIVEPDTNEVVGELVVDCAEVRSDSASDN